MLCLVFTGWLTLLWLSLTTWQTTSPHRHRNEQKKELQAIIKIIFQNFPAIYLDLKKLFSLQNILISFLFKDYGSTIQVEDTPFKIKEMREKSILILRHLRKLSSKRSCCLWQPKLTQKNWIENVNPKNKFCFLTEISVVFWWLDTDLVHHSKVFFTFQVSINLKKKSLVSVYRWQPESITKFFRKKRNARFWGWLLLCGTLDAGFYIKREGMEFKIHFQRTTVNICHKKMPQNKF